MLSAIRCKHVFNLTGIVVLLCAVPLISIAALDWTVEVTEAAAIALSGLTAAEFDGVAVTSNISSTLIYFADSQSGWDAVNRWDGTNLTLFATEEQLDPHNVAPNTPNASFYDMTCDKSGVLYLLIGGTGYQEVLWRVPGDDFSNAVLMMAIPDINEAAEIAVDETNSRLVVAYNDFYGVPGPSFGEGIGYVPLNATNASVTQLASEAELQAVINAIPGSTSGDIDPYDVTVQSDGTVLVSHGFNSNAEETGSIIKVSAGGGASLFASAATLITAAGADPAVVNIGSVHLHTLSDDRILAHVAFSSNNTTLEPFIAAGSPDGSTWQVLATQSQILADPDMAAFTSIGDLDGKHGNVDGNDDYWWHQQTPNGIVKMTGISASSSVDNWALYQ